MAELYPEIEPYDHGMMDVGDGNLVYWEVCGNPQGKPAVVLHGGPGSGCNPGMRRYFDPEVYRTILFDQRNAGRSTPHASDPSTDLSANTTDHLISDLEQLRRHLGIDQWLIFGGSWGATLALAYAERYPERVSEIVLVAVTSTRRSEIDWLYHGVGRLLPEEWDRFRKGVPEADRNGNLVDAYHRLLEGSDKAVREQAAKDWCDWEDAVVASSQPDYKPSPRYAQPEFRMAFARIVTHYFANGAWLVEGLLLREAHRLAGIPGVLIHGRLDLGSPLDTAWELSKAWPDSKLIALRSAGHSARDPGMGEATLDALNGFRPAK